MVYVFSRNVRERAHIYQPALPQEAQSSVNMAAKDRSANEARVFSPGT